MSLSSRCLTKRWPSLTLQLPSFPGTIFPWQNAALEPQSTCSPSPPPTPPLASFCPLPCPTQTSLTFQTFSPPSSPLIPTHHSPVPHGLLSPFLWGGWGGWGEGGWRAGNSSAVRASNTRWQQQGTFTWCHPGAPSVEGPSQGEDTNTDGHLLQTGAVCSPHRRKQACRAQ